MKKILCFILSISMILTFTACKDKKEVNDNSVDLEYYAKSGSIPECKYTLGSDVKTLKDELSTVLDEEHDDESEAVYDEIEGEKTVCVTNGVYNFYYEKENEDKGIAYIASFDTAFGFEIGEVIVSVKEAIGDIEYTEEEVNEENAFFMFAQVEGSVIKCEFEKNTIMFVFENNALCATAIYRNDF